MASRRLSEKTEQDRRILSAIREARPWFPDHDLQKITRSNLPVFVAMLRDSESACRKLRERLEALQTGSARQCPHCGRPVVGRSDAIYCGPQCRVRAFRQAHRNESSRITPL